MKKSAVSVQINASTYCFLMQKFKYQKEDDSMKEVSQSILQPVAARIISELKARGYSAVALNTSVNDGDKM